jgi:carboxypeptidase C (cathepsin A)
MQTAGRLRRTSCLIALAAMLTCTAYAQAPRPADTPRQPESSTQQSGTGPARPARSPNTPRLPADATSDQTVELPGRALRFKATAGTIPIVDAGDGSLQAEIAYVAYARTDAEPARRPVTFVFNGGPGAASAYLQLGAMGPWRLPIDRVTPSTPPVLVPNAETWLDFTDLVFVDPPGTGYSRLASGDGVRRQFWSVDGDSDALAVFIRKWIEKWGRQTSPKFLAGESYGGFRLPRLARILQDRQQVGMSGLILISPVLDFGWRGQTRHSPLSWVARLPSMAAAAREAKGAPFDREALRDAERYAAGEYLQDLVRGERDSAARNRMSAKVAALTGLNVDLVRRLGGRVDSGTFEREVMRERGLVASSYDATVTAYDPDPYAATARYFDPVLTSLHAPLSAAMTDLYRRVLGWRIEDPYYLLNTDVSGRWDWGRGRSPPHVVDDLRTVLSLDPRLRVLVTHGATDLVTPYFENQLILDQLPSYGSAERLKFAVYGGGHMYYSRDASRRALRADAEALYQAALAETAPVRN